MRSLKYFVANSLDGFISRRDGSVDWLFMDQDYGMTGFFESVDTAVMGRKTYDKMEELAPGQSFPGLENYVFSRTKPEGKFNGIHFRSGGPAAWLSSLRERTGKDIWLVGGGEMVREFLRLHLVDEIGLTMHPRLLGDGIPLFQGPYPETELELVQCRQYTTGLVQLFYRVNKPR